MPIEGIRVTMLIITPSAHTRLRQLLAEHPEEHVVRLAVKELDDQRIALNITLEDSAQTDDMVQDEHGLTIAIAPDSVARLDGATLHYSDSHGFHLQHPESPVEQLHAISLN
jgi:Fe-S cluster assembly iron-binding protein IscA